MKDVSLPLYTLTLAFITVGKLQSVSVGVLCNLKRVFPGLFISDLIYFLVCSFTFPNTTEMTENVS